MPQTMTRARASAIRAVGLFAGALLLLGTGALALSGGPDPASVKPQREVKVPPLPAPQATQRVYPDEIAAFISSAYRHEFPDDETVEPAQTEAPGPASGATVRLVGVIGSGDGAMAIVGVDAEQLLLAPGESGPDFRVEEIHPDRIVMVRAGQRSEVPLGERQGPLAGDMRPGGFGAGGSAGAQSADVTRRDRLLRGEDDRDSGGYRSARRIEFEQTQRAAAAARGLEASGGSDAGGNQPVTVSGNGNSFTSATSGNGAANGPPGAPEGQGQPGRTQTRQSAGGPADGDPNN